MSWTKKQFILQAYEEIGFASYIYDLQPEQLNSALVRLDAMMAEWNALGIRLGYPIPGTGEAGNIDDVTNVPDAANSAIYLNLGLRVARFGKVIALEHKIAAKEAFDALYGKVVAQNVIPMQMPGTMPRGAGQKPWRINLPFVNPPTVPLTAGPDSAIEFN